MTVIRRSNMARSLQRRDTMFAARTLETVSEVRTREKMCLEHVFECR